jgi:hypothetical protein
MNEGLWAIIGLVVGALLGLLPKLFDLYSNSAREEQEQTARLRMMLAGVLMSCVNSTNEFLNHAALLRLGPRPAEGDLVPAAEVRQAVDLAFAMKTAWMHALVSFGDRVGVDEPIDRRRQVIQGMLNDLDETYGIYQDGGVTPEQVIDQRQVLEQLQEVATLSRTRLQQLLRLPAAT